MNNLFKNSVLALACTLLAVGLASGCKPKPPAESIAAGGYFQTPWQSECQFIVQAIVSDVAEQMSYAKFHRLPDPKHFSVVVTERAGSPSDAPVYEIQIRLDPKQSNLGLEVSVNGPIWSPAVYQNLTEKLAGAVGLSGGSPAPSQDTSLFGKLAAGAPDVLEKENQRISAALDKDFTNSALHEEAALLLGAFLLRDHSGQFFEIRSPLSRITAHLAMARFLRGTGAESVQGRVAEAMLLSLIGDQAWALERLKGIDTNDSAVTAVVRALRTRTTGDYRPLDQATDRSPIENAEWFLALADYTGTPSAWLKLSDEQQQTIDFVRAANHEGYSVEIGHQLLRGSIPLELREACEVYELSHQKELRISRWVEALNALPERCFSSNPRGEVHVRVISWGQWAQFFQRHLCHAVQQNFDFMNRMWGVPDEAKDFATKCERDFGGLRLYPFVRRFNCTEEQAYHRAVDDAFKVTVATPQLVPAQCWNSLCYKVRFAPLYSPNPNPHINEWHDHNPPPDTVYDLNPRLNHPSLIGRADAVARFERLHELAPYDCRISNCILRKKYNERPTYDQAIALYGAVLPYSVFALRTVAWTVQDKPEEYEQLLLQATKLNPACYYDLADYFRDRRQEDKAARYLDKACAADPDTVRVSNRAGWRMRYYLSKGETDKAREIVDEAGEVYSFAGLEAKAGFFEATTNYDAAFEWHGKIEERYGKSAPLVRFCLRHKSLTGDRRFDPEVKKRLHRLFPKGVEKVSLKDFQGPPADGVLIKQENELLRSAGLKTNDVIVAVYGVRVHNQDQYMYGRDLKNTPELDLIVWQGDAYREFKPSPPNHQFNLEFGNYQPK